MVQDLGKLTKQQLIEQITALEALEAQKELTDSDYAENLLHELQVHQIELEMQNRELRESQQLLEEVRDRYADLYDFAPVSYITFDSQGIVQNINLTGAEALGRVRSNIIGQPFTKCIESKCLGAFFNHLKKTLQSDHRTTDEIQITSRNDYVMDIRIESSRVWSVDKSAFICQSVMIDVTKQKKSEQEMSLQARQLKLITDALPLLITYINRNEEFEFINKTATEWFDLPADEIMGKKVSDIFEDKKHHELSLKLRLCSQGKILTFEIESPFSVNEKKFISITLIPDYDTGNNVHGVIMMAGDITERLQLESITRKRLLDSAHIARVNAMGEMSSEIAHELNQPLAAISIFSDACRRMIKSEKAKPEELIKSLDDINQQAVRAGEVIRRIRAFTARNELQIESVGICELVKEAVQLVTVELRSHHVKLKIDLPDNLTLVMADRILIEQVVLNLARNAIDAMDVLEASERLLRIRIFGTRTGEVEVSVEDSGPGMPAEQIKQVFEAFHTTKVNGMGMGLTICHSIIDVHHGRIWSVQNEQGGTTFSFTLPLKGAEDNETA